MTRFSRYTKPFTQTTNPSSEQYVVAIVAKDGRCVGFAPPFDKDNSFNIVANLSEAQHYPKSTMAYKRCKGMHVARSMIVSRINGELASIDTQLAGKPTKSLRTKLQKERAAVQQDFDDVCGFNFQIKKI
jgi:hypothetical protein